MTENSDKQSHPDLSSYQQGSGNWRRQIRRNTRRTRIIIALFILLYLLVGFLVDILVFSFLYHAKFETSLWVFATLRRTPYAMLVMGGLGIFSVMITYLLHDKFMMMGMNAHEIKPNQTETLEEKQLYNTLEEMKVAAGLRYMPRVFIIKADYMNAFASGYSEKSAIVAITTGLMRKLNRNELQAVMAHELSHIRHLDIKLTLMASVLSNIMLIVLDLLFRKVIYGGRRIDNRILLVILVLRFVLPLLTMILMFYLSRTREYMADAGAVELMRDNKPMASALLKIKHDHNHHIKESAAEYRHQSHEDVRRAAYIFDPKHAGVRPLQSIATLFSTHPTVEDRLKAIGFTRES